MDGIPDWPIGSGIGYVADDVWDASIEGRRVVLGSPAEVMMVPVYDAPELKDLPKDDALRLWKRAHYATLCDWRVVLVFIGVFGAIPAACWYGAIVLVCGWSSSTPDPSGGEVLARTAVGYVGALGGLVVAGRRYERFYVVRVYRRIRVLRGWACSKCLYGLTGNTSGVCPECGEVLRQPPPAVSTTQTPPQEPPGM